MLIRLKSTRNTVQLILICLLLSASSIRMFNAYTKQSEYIYQLIRVGLLLFTVLTVSLNWKKMLKPLLVIVIFSTVVGLHYFVYEANRQYITGIFEDHWIYLVAIFLVVYISEFETIEKGFLIGSIITLAFDILLLREYNFRRLMTEYDYGNIGAVFSYSVLLPAITFLYFFNKKKNPIYIVLSFISFYCIFAYGSNRMSMISYTICLFYILFWSKKGISFRKLIISIIGAICIIIAIINLKGFITWILSVLKLESYSTRIVALLDSDALLIDSGRTELITTLLRKVFSIEGIVGYGIAGDQVLTETHQYAHNIALEMIIEFGFVRGTMYIVFLVYIIYKTIKRRTMYNAFLIIPLFSHLLSLLVSGTFWNNEMFYVLGAIALKITGEEGFIENYLTESQLFGKTPR